MSELSTRCACREVRGRLRVDDGLRLTCCCSDCQTYARHLGVAGLPDEFGGSEVVQVAPSAVAIDHGFEHIRALRLTASGLYRFYASCCGAPICNAVSAGMPFHGVYSVFVADRHHLDEAVGPSEAYTQIHAATKPIPSELRPRRFPAGLIARSFGNVIRWKLAGEATKSPFFDSRGDPIPAVEVLTAQS